MERTRPVWSKSRPVLADPCVEMERTRPMSSEPCVEDRKVTARASQVTAHANLGKSYISTWLGSMLGVRDPCAVSTRVMAHAM